MPSSLLSFLASAPELPGTSPDEYIELYQTAPRVVESERLDPRVRALVRARANDPRFVEPRALDASPFLARARNEGVAVVGAGLMGTSIAASFVNARFPTLAYDPVEAARDAAPARIERELTTLRAALGDAATDPDEEASLVRALIDKFYRVSDELADVARRPVVVESIPEKLKLKLKLYRELDALGQSEILLMTNTSSLRVAELSAELPRASARRPLAAERFLAFHFFHPATKRAAVELAFGSATSQQTLDDATAFARAIRKTPLRVADSQGFLVNRLLQAYLNESLALLDERVEPARLEALAREMGMEGPPLRILDEIGLDVALRSGWSFLKAFPTRTHESKALEELVRAGKLGRKTQLGFYRYASSTPWRDDATLEFGANESAASDDARADDETLARRIAIAIFMEAARCVDEGVANSYQEADVALTLALGFPRAKGGICYWAFASGLATVLAEADQFNARGDRFTPPRSLVRVADSLQRGRDD